MYSKSKTWDLRSVSFVFPHTVDQSLILSRPFSLENSSKFLEILVHPAC